jgi:branched-chain amino acid transport system ATP-binding protein
MTALLEIDDLGIAYGRVEAVRGVSLTVEAGTIITVIGANGAGKTTLLAGIMGLLPVSGRITFEGADLARLDVEDRVERGIALVPERRELFAEMPVADNLLLGGYRATAAQRRARLEEVYALFPRLLERRAQAAGTLSGGERQMLALGRALIGAPRLLMLDEPSLGLAPLIVAQIFATISTLRARGASVLLVEQNALMALNCADAGYVLETGQIALSGPAADLRADARLTALYLGGEVG